MKRPAPLLTIQQAAEPTGFIYFVRTRKAIKIGYAKNVAKRVAALQVGNANRLTVMLELPGTMEDEAKIHWLFAEHRMRGEWFRPDLFVLTSIDIMRETGSYAGFVAKIKQMNWEAEERKKRPMHPVEEALMYTVRHSIVGDPE